MDSLDQSTSTAQSANRQIVRAAGTVMIAMVMNQVFSLVSSILINQVFGTGMANEAYNAANKFADILYQLVAGGALASAFVPTFTGLLANHENETAWKLASSIANLVTLILVAVTALSAIFAPWLVQTILAPGFINDPAKFQLTVQLLRIQLAAPILFGLSGLMMGIINAHQSFLLPALAPSMYSIGKIIGMLLLVPGMGPDGLAVGVVIGAAMHGLIQLPALLRLPGRKYNFSLGLDLPQVREVARLMGPRLLGVAFVQLNFLINTQLASLQPEGSVTAINVAFQLMLIPEAAIAQAVATAALPTFSMQAAQGKLSEMRSSLASLLRGIVMLALPAALGLILLRQPLVALIYQSEVFDAESVRLVAWALLWYAAGLVFHSIVEIVSRAFYALHDTKTPVFVGVAAMSLNVVFSLLFTAWFARIGWMPHGGLALANSLATALESAALLWFMRRKLHGLEGRRILKGILLALLCTLVMSAALAGWLNLTNGRSLWLTGLGGIAAGVLVYGVMLVIMRVPEVTAVFLAIRRRFRKIHG